MDPYPTDKKYHPKRAPGRETFDRAVVHRILDEGYVAHVAFQNAVGQQVVPMFYVRDGEAVLLHASTKGGLTLALGDGQSVALGVTLLDGLVLARSAFHHSMNYRSVVVHGVPERLEGEDKVRALDLFTRRVRGEAWHHARPANAQELKATAVVRLPLQQVAAKVRTGGPNDDAEDMDLGVWAGVVPLSLVVGTPVQSAPALSDAGAPVGRRFGAGDGGPADGGAGGV